MIVTHSERLEGSTSRLGENVHFYNKKIFSVRRKKLKIFLFVVFAYLVYKKIWVVVILVVGLSKYKLLGGER